MDVTRKNFKESLEVISKTIKQSTFLAVDSEFTGLSPQGSCIHAFETPEERYRKLKETATQFLSIQFGLAAFEYLPELDRYSVKVFNFYVFPRPFARQAPDPRFICQSSSIDFLASQGFDFNKLFRDGISYLRQADEEQLKTALQEKHALIDVRSQAQKNSLGAPVFSSPAFSSPSGDSLLVHKGPCNVPDEHKEFIEGVCSKLENFLNSDEPEMALQPCNGFLRKLIFQAVAQRFQSGLHLESKTSDKRLRYILVTKVAGEEEMKKREEAKRAAEFEEVDDAVGFCKVIQMLCQSGKLVLGHNMYLDLLYLIDQFCCSLPEDYDEFKHMTRSLLPRVLDTKHMASTPPFRELIMNTALADLRKTLEYSPFSKPTVDFPEGFPNYTEKENFHEAGYDAFVTGLNFIAMANFLGKNAHSKCETVLPSSRLIEPFINKLFLMRMPDIPYVNLEGPDKCPARDHVFHVTFPREWKVPDLQQLFGPFGNVQINWINESSAFVALHRHEQVDVVLRHIPQSEFYKVSSYQEHISSRKYTPSVFDTPKQFAGEKRKPSVVSDVELPRKKRRSSREFASNRSITTIPEEEEASEVTEDAKVIQEATNGSIPVKLGESITIDTPKTGKKRSADEMFEVPDNW